jgi:hypothetical protein
MGSGGYWYPPNNSRMFFYTITKWSYKKNGLTAPTLLDNILQWNKVKLILFDDFCEACSKDFMWPFW